MATVILLGGFVTGAALLVAERLSSPDVLEITLPAEIPGDAAMVVVQVAGEVWNPGVYTLAPTARVSEAIKAAGGVTAEANAGGLNMAAVVRDGARYDVPRVGEAPAVVGEGLININTADADALESLTNIGPVLAQAIIDHRTRVGPFERVEDILLVPGIGPKTLEQLRSEITAR